MCLYPNETCETTSVESEIKFDKNGTIAIAPEISIYAILCANPI